MSTQEKNEINDSFGAGMRKREEKDWWSSMVEDMREIGCHRCG